MKPSCRVVEAYTADTEDFWLNMVDNLADAQGQTEQDEVIVVVVYAWKGVELDGEGDNRS